MNGINLNNLLSLKGLGLIVPMGGCKYLLIGYNLAIFGNLSKVYQWVHFPFNDESLLVTAPHSPDE